MGAPTDGTVEAWAWAYLHADTLDAKLAPPPPPREWETTPPSRRVAAPARPKELVAASKGLKATGSGALRDPLRRAEVLHTFLHHELQAAELMCWALLAFADAPPAFRRGLLGVFDDEVRHMRMYGEHMAKLGLAFGERPVNDWFWERVPQATTAAHFAAGMGMGFEGGNLDHATRFAMRFEAAGDHAGAELQSKVAAEEVPHVAFATHWFRAFTGGLDFDVWQRHLPEPLSPMIMRGRPMNEPARRRAGFTPEFLARLASW